MVRSWTAGHSDIKRNEEVDAEAKKAADGLMSEEGRLPKILRKQLKNSWSAARRLQHEKIKARWRSEWEKSPKYDRITVNA